ncbi:hypothetical protein T265_11831 [Opisthorchis viverrini]|uniref:Peptidase A1 domain-containing protein n=1 Tax=Opisthorchis viverrini TaxID=6198 RepID=A0A074Z1L0_OPIVI|nr:hypothetical protein T265_11831 [Opisthorchis viverrini]KER19372.1 hypothetical protein T265_11831 [Opisthorchis viverrini]
MPVFGDGHLGLAFPSLGRRVHDFNVLDVMSANGMIDYDRFTLFCVCADHRNDLQPDACLVFGSHGTVNPAEFQMVQLDDARGGWKVRIQRTATQEVFRRPFVAKLDSTVWLNKLSVERAEEINTALGAQRWQHLHVVDCNRVDQMPTLLMSFDDVRLDLHPRMYIRKDLVEGQMRCFSSIVPDPEITTDHMTLGMAFMEQFIVMFDQREGKVGFKPRVC